NLSAISGQPPQHLAVGDVSRAALLGFPDISHELVLLCSPHTGLQLVDFRRAATAPDSVFLVGRKLHIVSCDQIARHHTWLTHDHSYLMQISCCPKRMNRRTG